ncbi:glycosyltransferase [Terrisporobacter mayombei]|uniref:glycosyltransferase n=1 Tax=Terrisporobacter mayombei TaxID=1541 RepID=UPI0028160679|nr:glycosyltransferase [Terrisporobacter mayombei]MCC3869655.1 glycosyltransferase [Terrisporobacter mayombei]
MDLLKYIDYHKYEVDLILFEDLGDYIDEIPEDVNLIFYNLTKTYGSFFKCIFNNFKNREGKYVLIRSIFYLERVFGAKVKKLLKPLFKSLGKYDCAIAYRMGICTDFVAYVVSAKNKITWWHHGSYDYNEKQTKEIENVYKNFNHIVSVSEGCKKMILDNVNVPENKIVVIPNIIDFNNICNKSLEKIDDNLYEKDDINIVSIGRLSSEKGMINCVFACKKLIDLGYKVKWFLIGDGLEYEKIKHEILASNLEDKVYLLGSKKNPYSYLKNADIYVHPSYIESMSITVLEAMCLDKPLVVAKSIGPSEFIKNKENGILVNSDVEGLVDGVRCLLDNNKLYNKLSNKDLNVLKNYTYKSVVLNIEEIINKI